MSLRPSRQIALAALRRQLPCVLRAAPCVVPANPCAAPSARHGGFDALLLARGLHEVVSAGPADHAAAFGFALACAARQRESTGRPVLIATLAREAQERGCLHGAGLAPLGLDARRVLTVTARNEQALLWAAEEGATCSALGAVVAVLGARETLYGFTASRRLKLRQEASSVPVFVVRFNAGDATAATARWRIAAVPSLGYATPSSALALPGPLRWRVTRERHAGRPPQTLEIECDATHGLRVAAPACDRPAGAQARRGKAA